jgi:hypothetical protein
VSDRRFVRDRASSSISESERLQFSAEPTIREADLARLDRDLKTFHQLLLAWLRELEAFSLAANFLDVFDNWIANACRIYLRWLVADHLREPLARDA